MRWGTPIAAWAAVLAATLLGASGAAAAPPPNDDFGAAAVLAGLPAEATGTTAEATLEPGEPSHGSGGGHSIWFTWHAEASGWVSADPCESGYKHVVVYVGNAVSSLTRVAANDSEAGCAAGPERKATFRAAAGFDYRIAVDRAVGDPTNFAKLRLEAVPPPPHDGFSDPQWLGGSLARGEGQSLGAGREPGEPAPFGLGGATIWFAWTAPHDGAVEISTCGSDFGARPAAYVGDSVDALVPIGDLEADLADGCENASVLSFGASTGITYRIAVDGNETPGGQVGAGEVWLRLFLSNGYPGNDSFATPRRLVLGEPMEESGTGLATKEFGEPDHAGKEGGSSVWFEWTPLRDGTAHLDTCGSGFDTLLAVYTGSSVRALTPVAANDDTVTCSAGGGSRLDFPVAAGTQYRIAVDGAGGAGGQLRLFGSLDPGPLQRAYPNTFITSLRVDSRHRRVKLGFRGTPLVSGFRCKLDRSGWESCTSPWRLSGLRPGRHVIRVASNLDRVFDPTPRVKRFRIRS